MRRASSTPREALSAITGAINRRTGSEWDVVRRLGGWNHGAWLLRDRTGRRAVLKVGDAQFGRQLRRMAPVIEHARSAGWPTPAWLAWGVDHGLAYHVQDYEPGRRLVDVELTAGLVDVILGVNDVQSSLKPPRDQHSWAGWPRKVLFEDAGGWASAMRAHSAETASLLRVVEEFAMPLNDTSLPQADLVHGDFNFGNLLVRRGAVIVIDVSSVGAGPRGYDLARFVLAALAVPRPPDRTLIRRMVEHARSSCAEAVWRICLCAQAVEWAGFGASYWPADDTRGFAERAEIFLEEYA